MQPLLTQRQAAEMLALSERTLERFRVSGLGPKFVRMNEQHAIIDNVGGKTVIASWEPSSLDPSRRVWVFQNKESFLLRYSNRFATIEISDMRGGSIRSQMPLGQWWLTHRDRRQYRGITFQPDAPKVVNECLNLWQHWGCEAREGDWSLIRDHIEAVLADGNSELAEYIIRWIAWSIKNPGAQAEVALVLIGDSSEFSVSIRVKFQVEKT